MKDAAMLVAFTVVDGLAEWIPFDWAGHVESSDCPCEPIFDREYRIHRSFSDPDIQSPAYTETADVAMETPVACSHCARIIELDKASGCSICHRAGRTDLLLCESCYDDHQEEHRLDGD